MPAKSPDKGQSNRHVPLVVVCVAVLFLLYWNATPGLLTLYPGVEHAFYNLQVQGFRAGELSLITEPPPALTQLANPYDPVENRPFLKEFGDLSYYHGKLYLYFGPAPALVLYWPWLALTGHYLSDQTAVFICLATGFLALTRLLYGLWKSCFPEVSFWIFTAGIAVVGLAIATLEAEWWWSDVYEVAQSCGFAFTMLALVALWQAFQDKKRRVAWLLLASLAYGLAVASRPSLLLGGIILLAPVICAWKESKEKKPGRKLAGLTLAALAPLIIIGLGLMIFNARRFGNPFEFGWRYQICGVATQYTGAQFSPRFLGFNLFYYFLEPMRWMSYFPFLQTYDPSSFGGHFQATKSTGGILLVNFPLLWLALAAPLGWKTGPGQKHLELRWFAWALAMLFAMGLLVVCLFSTAESRYELDFLPALMILSVVGIWSVERWSAPLLARRKRTRWGWGSLMAVTMMLDILASVEARAMADNFDGNYLRNAGQTDEGILYLRKALALSPQSANLHFCLGSAFYMANQFDPAISEYQRAQALEPDPHSLEAVDIEVNLSLIFLHQRNLDQAIAHLQNALKINPNIALAHKGLGDCYTMAGRLEDAIAEYQRAAELTPNMIEAQDGLGLCLLHANRVNEALVPFQKVVELQPGVPQNHDDLGCCLLQIGRVDEAIGEFQKAIELDPNFARSYSHLGDSFKLKGMMSEANACYQKAQQLSGSSASP